MKRCPKCNFSYTDDTLEFCLEDGSRLLSVVETRNQIPPITNPFKPTLAADKTVSFHDSDNSKLLDFQPAKNFQSITETSSIEEKSIVRNYKIIEIASITVSLIHNWWQWLYLNNQYYSSFSSYVLSANFLMWLLLLAFGATVGIYGLKQSQNKALPITGLVILSINLLLFLVPKH